MTDVIAPPAEGNTAKLSGRHLLRSLLNNVTWGIRWGLRLGCVFSLLALGARVVAGSSGFDKVHTTVWAFVALYLVGGIVSGTIVGLLRPILRWRVGGLVTGIVATFPIALALRTMADGFAPWDHFATELVVSFTLIVGGGCGLGWWRKPNAGHLEHAAQMARSVRKHRH
jgi:hypothetical protein